MHLDRISVDIVRLWRVDYLEITGDSQTVKSRFFTNKNAASVFYQLSQTKDPITTHDAIMMEDDNYYLLDEPLEDVYHGLDERAGD